MNYDEILNEIEILKTNNNEEIKEKLLKENINESIKTNVETKIIELIKNKFNDSVEKIINNLNDIFLDVNTLDLNLINFKKNTLFIYDLINIKAITDENKKTLKDLIKSETNNVYDILLNYANTIDKTGVFGITVKNNKIKWSD